MNANQFAVQLKKTIEEIKENGTEKINCESLIAFLSGVIKSSSLTVPNADLEKYKAELQLWVEQNKNSHSFDIEMFRSVILAGQNAIRSSFLLNGGAALAILTFIGKLTESQPDKIPEFANSLTIFVVAILITTISSGITYLGQWFFAGKKPWKEKIGFGLNIFAIILGLLSYGVFIWGIYISYDIFSTYV